MPRFKATNIKNRRRATSAKPPVARPARRTGRRRPVARKARGY